MGEFSVENILSFEREEKLMCRQSVMATSVCDIVSFLAFRNRIRKIFGNYTVGEMFGVGADTGNLQQHLA